MNIKHMELVAEANEFLQKNYEMKLTIPILFNTRLKKVFGRFRYRRENGKFTPTQIEMSVDFMKTHPKDHILDVLRHELVHYALCAKGYTEKQFDDGHYIFESELKRLGVKPTRTYGIYGKLHLYQCNLCGTSFKRKRKLPATVRCTCSVHSEVIYHGEIELDHLGNEKSVASEGVDNEL